MADAPASNPARIELRAIVAEGQPVVEGDFTLGIGDEAVAFHVIVPEAPATLEALLPVLQGLSSEVAQRAASKATADGRTISCRAGCGACCRQAVPVAEAEARMLAGLVEAMPEPRRSVVRARFAAAEQRLDETATASEVTRAGEGAIVTDVGDKYFGLGVPCPFLEAESCSIHPDRPLRCREYFVTSPAAACVAMAPGTIDRVLLAGVPSKAVYAAGADKTPQGWLLLTQSLAFVEHFPDPSEARPAQEWIGEVVGRMAAQARLSRGA